MFTDSGVQLRWNSELELRVVGGLCVCLFACKLHLQRSMCVACAAEEGPCGEGDDSTGIRPRRLTRLRCCRFGSIKVKVFIVVAALRCAFIWVWCWSGLGKHWFFLLATPSLR